MGRPRRFEDCASKRLTVRLTPAQRLELERVALEKRTDVTSVVREAVNVYVADYGERPVFRRGGDD